jgi:HEAT repeat protein
MDSSDSGIQELVKDLSHKNEDVRWGAAFTLERIGLPAVDYLVPAREDKDSVAWLRSAWALGRIGDLRATDSLITALRDGDWAVRMRAGKALDASLISLRDEKPKVRRHSIGALTRIEDPSSADRLNAALRNPDWRVRMGAALALTAIGEQKSFRYFEAATSDKN